MRTNTILYYTRTWAMALLLTWGLASCSSDSEQADDHLPRTYQLRLDVQRGDFGTDTRAATEWKDGERVYFRFSIGSTRIGTWADYSAEEDLWTLDAVTSKQLSAKVEPLC